MFNILQRIKNQLLGEKINGKRYLCGMLKHTADARDFQYSWLGAAAPLAPLVDIKTVTIRDQKNLNNCCFQAAVTQKDVDEGLILSARYVTAEAAKRGRVVGNGFSSLRNAQQTIVDIGACEQSFLPEVDTDFNRYIDPSNLTYNVEVNGELHKSKAFFQATTKQDWLNALNSGRIIHTGLEWYTGYNMNNGLSAPYVLTLGKGLQIGGHSVVCKGYDLAKNLYKFQNSYGPAYGDNGCFYVDISAWHASSESYVGYVTVDTDYWNPASRAFEGKDVKGNGPKIYRILNGQRCWYPSEAVFNYFGGTFSPPSYVPIADLLLNAISDGPNMTQ